MKGLYCVSSFFPAHAWFDWFRMIFVLCFLIFLKFRLCFTGCKLGIKETLLFCHGQILCEGHAPSDPKRGSCLCSLFIAVSLICSVYFVGSAFVGKQYKERLNAWNLIEAMQKYDKCKDWCRPSGSEALPEGIVTKKSNYKMQPLWGSSLKGDNSQPSMSLLAIAVGIKQKEIVDRIVKKFPFSDFVVMLFHYDGVVDKWRDLSWSAGAIHVSAVNQTKWWFAKRFLHPDIVAEYNYIFLWDEDLEVENFNPRRYLSIVKNEGLEISQPALDPSKSIIHQQITARIRSSIVHRRIFKFKGSGRCYENSTLPPCTGWVEMMAPVFSMAAWRCTWYMIQNDLIHAWGLDRKLGYCAQGDWTKNVGVVDAEYIVHLGLSTLGIFNGSEALLSKSKEVDKRPQVRAQSYVEMNIFNHRWEHAEKEDRCWADPYQQLANQTRH